MEAEAVHFVVHVAQQHSKLINKVTCSGAPMTDINVAVLWRRSSAFCLLCDIAIVHHEPPDQKCHASWAEWPCVLFQKSHECKRFVFICRKQTTTKKRWTNEKQSEREKQHHNLETLLLSLSLICLHFARGNACVSYMFTVAHSFHFASANCVAVTSFSILCWPLLTPSPRKHPRRRWVRIYFIGGFNLFAVGTASVKYSLGGAFNLWTSTN